MGELRRVDALAMETVAEVLEDAVSSILLTDMNWPAPQGDCAADGVELHVESARLWVESVVERLQVWAKRARRIGRSLEVHQHRL
jgi:hypothetical protein